MLALPQEAPHFFTDVSLEVVHEVPYVLLVEVSQLAQINGSTSTYRSLRHALCKLQWAKLAAIRAIDIDQVLTSQIIDEYILVDTVAQSEHAKSILEIVSYGKAVTDALSHFLNEKWTLRCTKNGCDLKWQTFRDAAGKCDPLLLQFFSTHNNWLDKDSRTADSLPAARDEWLHRGVPRTAMFWPPTELGTLPVLRTLSPLTNDLPPDGTSLDFMSTRQFATHHLANLMEIFVCVLRAAVEAERRIAPGHIVKIADGPPISFFLTRITQSRMWSGMRLGPYAAHLSVRK